MERKIRAGRFFVASLLLALGSVLLFFGSLTFLGEIDALHPVFTVPALLLHGVGWYSLFLACRDDAWLYRAYLSSLGAFALGLSTLFIIFPGQGVLAPLGLEAMIGLFFPYVPSVYAPVVLVHSVLFALARVRLLDGRAATLVAIGIFSLMALAAFALWSQTQNLPPISSWLRLRPWPVVLAGMTAIGYSLVSAGFFWSEASKSRIQSSSGS